MESRIKANILLVDDRPENLLALEATLNKIGQNLIRASSGEEALRQLLYHDFAVILLDVQMPGIDGFETAMLIRQRDRSRHTPIIFLTAFSSSDNFVSKGYSLGAVDYLLKPIDPEILLSKVTVFVDLYKKTMEVKTQAAQLAAINTELSQSEERFRSLCACSPIGIFLADNEGKIHYSNPICQEICGFEIGENWAAGWGKCIHEEDCDRVVQEWSICTQKGQPYKSEFRINTSDGTVRWVGLRTSPMLSENKQLGQVGTIEDITEHKQAQAAQEQLIREQVARQQAEEANRMKDEFLAVVSHELRTPLNSIMGWSKLLLTKQFDEVTTTRALETIERNAKAQTQLIEDILDVSKIMRGQLRISLEKVSLINLIESVLETVRPQADLKEILIESQFDADAEIVIGDAERLQQIIWNLLSNAIKFTTQPGRIEIRLKRIEQINTENIDHQRLYTQLQVIDKGIGINPDFLPYVFDRFRQADSTTTRAHGGLGLGLAIVRHLVELHGGKIEAYSEGEGKGATFTVYLPASACCNEISCKEQPCTTQMDGKAKGGFPNLDCLQILVVEDHRDTREFITNLLEQSGAKVKAVDCVKEAMKYLEESSPDILVSDIGMPQQDGFQLIRQVREKGKKFPAIALTAYSRIEDQQQAIAAGFQMHLSKPIEPNKLLTLVSKLVSDT
jgi:PAS domain S-box-containing protein